jgi:Zn-finger nucleic acid-binding protein
MHCPKCGGLLSTRGRGEVASCSSCGGMFVPRGKNVTAGDILSASPAGHDEEGGRCPGDQSIMSRATVELGQGARTFHLERCPSCHGVWFDEGEWNALATEHLLDRLDEFWTVEWRTKQRRDHDHREYEARVKEEFGPELHAQLLSLAGVLKDHPRRSQALAFLREKSD